MGVWGRVLSAAVFETPAGVAGLDDVAVVGQAIEHGGGHPGVAEHLGPIGESQVGGDQQRGVLLTLEPIPEENRRPEAELWAAFEAERPRILGVLLDAVAKGLAELPRTKLDKLPRMADFALWATACETALWPAGTFWSAYCGNRDEAVEGVIDADPVAVGVRALMQAQTEWTGTATELLGALAEVVDDRIVKSKTWPDNPRALGGRLRRAATFLRKIGVDISFEREGGARTRTINITTTIPAPENEGVGPSAPSASSADPVNANSGNGFGPHGLQMVDSHADGSV